MTGGPGDRRNDKGVRPATRRSIDARGGRPTGSGSRGGRPGRAFRPLRWAWLLLLMALLAPAYDLFLPAGWRPAGDRRTVVIDDVLLPEWSPEVQAACKRFRQGKSRSG